MDAPATAHRLLNALAGLPDESLVPVGHVRRLLGADAYVQATDLLDVPTVARLLDRSLSTARNLLATGRIAGFRLNDREWRCTWEDMERYLADERDRFAADREMMPGSKPRRRGRPRELSAWRKEVGGPAE